MKKDAVKRLTLAAMFMAIGYILPFATGSIPRIGNMLLPMHIPVFLCGLICGWQYGLVVGLLLPLLRSLTLSMPPLYPIAIAMSVELATYGFVAGFAYEHSRWHCVFSLCKAMILAMITGRIVWGIAEIILLGLKGNVFTLQMFAAGAFFNAIPGIVLQFVCIPAVMVALNKAGLVRFGSNEKNKKNADARQAL